MVVDFIGVAIFAVFIRLFTTLELNVKLSAFLVAFLALLINKLIEFAPILVANKSMETPLSVGDVSIFFIHFIVAAIVFHKIRKNDDSLIYFGLWISFGVIISYVLLPSFAPMLFGY